VPRRRYGTLSRPSTLRFWPSISWGRRHGSQ
jgi:hypothetical protein